MSWKPKKERPISWSAISAFAWNAEEWHEKYVVHGDCTRDKDGLLGFCVVTQSHNRFCPAVQTSPQMLFGSKIGNAYAADPAKFRPKLPIFKIYEHEYRCSFDKIPLVGYADGWTPEELHLGELKTGVKKWDQKRADEHGQITMYNLMAFLIDGVKPEAIRSTLMWLPTEMKGDVVSLKKCDPVFIETRRTMKQVLEFGTYIKKTVAAMQEYAETVG